MNGDTSSAWDWVTGINAMALTWYQVFTGDPVPPSQGGSGASGSVSGKGAAFTLDLGTVVTIAAVALLMIVLLRRR
jgi:hypothetical protein